MEYDINKLDKNYDNTNFITNLRVDPPAGTNITSRGADDFKLQYRSSDGYIEFNI